MTTTHTPKKSESADPAVKRGRPRGTVSPDDMITAAFELAEQVGLSEMTMPQLARRMNLPVTTIYWHFRTRDNLVNAMLARAIKHHYVVTPFVDDGTAWDEALKNYFRKMRLVFRGNPVLCDLVLLRSGDLGQAVDKVEMSVQALVDLGFSAGNALEVYFALSIHSAGSAILERINTTQHLPDRLQYDRFRASGVTRKSTSQLFESTQGGQTMVDSNFEFTLGAIIDRAKLLLAHDLAQQVSGPTAARAE